MSHLHQLATGKLPGPGTSLPVGTGPVKHVLFKLDISFSGPSRRQYFRIPGMYVWLYMHTYEYARVAYGRLIPLLVEFGGCDEE